MEVLDIFGEAVAHGVAAVGASKVWKGDKAYAAAQSGLDNRGLSKGNHGEQFTDSEGIRDGGPNEGGARTVDVGVEIKDGDGRRPKMSGESPVIKCVAVRGAQGSRCLSGDEGERIGVSRVQQSEV